MKERKKSKITQEYEVTKKRTSDGQMRNVFVKASRGGKQVAKEAKRGRGAGQSGGSKRSHSREGIRGKDLESPLIAEWRSAENESLI